MVQPHPPHPPLPSLLFLLLLLSPLLLCTSLSDTSPRGSSLPGGPLPTVAAAGPILQGQPFVVVWNMPTAHCEERYNIHLNLSDFNIVENQRQRFQGQNITIFYRDHLGKYPYLSRDERMVNGGIPQLGNRSAHLSLAVAQISSLMKPDFKGLAVIDWEEWQPIWERNCGFKMNYRRLSKLLVKKRRPDLSKRARTTLARLKFERSARRFMEETLQVALRDRPKGLWGFYGFPVCYNKHKRRTDENYTGRCHTGTKQQNDRLSWLWQQSSALYPSIYLPQRLAGSMDAALMVRYRLLETLRVASVWRYGNNTSHATPVLPYARLTFAHTLTFLNKTDLEHTLGESAALGAAGVVLWGELKFAKSTHQCILLRDYVHTVLGPFIQSLRSDTRRCSLQLCHGNGRCTRQHPTSGRMLFMTSDPNQMKHFMCLCYPGWTGQECKEKVDTTTKKNK